MLRVGRERYSRRLGLQWKLNLKMLLAQFKSFAIEKLKKFFVELLTVKIFKFIKTATSSLYKV